MCARALPRHEPADAFLERGYVVFRDVLDARTRTDIQRVVEAALTPLVGPVEFEADVGYPGAPRSREEPGGGTPRRLLYAYARHEVFRRLAQHPTVVAALSELLPGARSIEDVRLSQCHHNCIMTKHPGFSSATAWHQDIRYWSFDRPELISVWWAIGDEDRTNGALRAIPGSHELSLDRVRFDKDLFLRHDLGENKALIRTAEAIELDAGDVLLFSCRLFHAAGKNLSQTTKISPVFTYHACSNQPIPQTRSAQFPSVPVAEVARS